MNFSNLRMPPDRTKPLKYGLLFWIIGVKIHRLDSFSDVLQLAKVGDIAIAV
ncbi:hypothetical protein SAMN05660666_02794 [Novosphingobium aromaticivorans]|nr:hypothetical protein SAMN05660666_02794 [Novosphingobium aromaticivorans]